MGESPLSAEDIRAAAEVHRELGPDYSDAVVESFLSKIDEHIESRVEQRLARGSERSESPAPLSTTKRRRPVDPVRLSKRRIAVASFAAGSVVAGVPLTFFAVIWHGIAYAESPSSDMFILWMWVVIAAVCGLAAYRLRRR